MLDNLSDQLTKERRERRPPKPTIADRKIAMFEDILRRDLIFPTITQESSDGYKKSYETLLSMYRSGALDRSRITHVCDGLVIKPADRTSLPPKTIMDKPARQQYSHFRAEDSCRDVPFCVHPGEKIPPHVV